jgi:hypothetical protein
VSDQTAVTKELPYNAEAMERKDTAHDLPLGFTVLYGGLVLWGIWYLYAFSPWSTGWTQAGELAAAAAPVESNIFMTILMTALPTLAAVGLFMMQRRSRR